MALYTAQPSGFLPANTDHPSVVLQCALTSAATITAAGGVVTAGAGVSYSEDLGIQLSETSGVLFQTAISVANQAKLQKQGCFTLWVESAKLCDGHLAAVTHYFFRVIGGSGNFELRQTAAGTAQVNFGSTNSSLFLQLKEAGKPTLSRVDFSWIGRHVKVYIDYLLVDEFDGGVLKSNQFNLVHVGDNAHLKTVDCWCKDLQVSLQPIMLPASPVVRNIAWTGDSFVKQGQWPLNASNHGIIVGGWPTEDYVDTTVKCVDTNRDVGMIPTCQRLLHKAGFFPRKVLNFARGGTCWYKSATPLAAQAMKNRIDCLLDTGHAGGEYPNQAVHGYDAVFIVCGDNDATAKLIVDATITAATWQSTCEAQLDRLIAAGIPHIIIGTIPPLDVQVDGGIDYSAADYVTETDTLNGIIRGFADYDSSITVVDLFTRFGGHTNFDPADYTSTSDRHPSPQGSEKIGRWMTEAYLGAL